MARKSNTRATHGAGSIRQRPDGTWEARFVTGHDPGSGKAVRKSVYAKTQKEVRQKLAQAVAAVFGITLELGELGDKLVAVVNAAFCVLAYLGVLGRY